MLLVRFQVKGAMLFKTLEISIVGMTAVAFENISDKQKKSDVNQRRSQQNSVGRNDVMQIPSDGAGNKADDDNRHPKPLRKILAYKKFLAGAKKAAV